MDHLVHMDCQAPWVLLELQVLRVPKEWLELTGQMESLVPLDLMGLLGREAHLGCQGLMDPLV